MNLPFHADSCRMPKSDTHYIIRRCFDVVKYDVKGMMSEEVARDATYLTYNDLLLVFPQCLQNISLDLLSADGDVFTQKSVASSSTSLSTSGIMTDYTSLPSHPFCYLSIYRASPSTDRRTPAAALYAVQFASDLARIRDTNPRCPPRATFASSNP